MEASGISDDRVREREWREKKGSYESVGGIGVFGEERGDVLEGVLVLAGINGVPYHANATLRNPSS